MVPLNVHLQVLETISQGRRTRLQTDPLDTIEERLQILDTIGRLGYIRVDCHGDRGWVALTSQEGGGSQKFPYVPRGLARFTSGMGRSEKLTCPPKPDKLGLASRV